MSGVKIYKVTEPWLNTDCGLGEAPYWDKETNSLRFFDIIKKKMHHVDLNKGPSSHKTIDLPFSIGTTANIEGNDEEFIFGGKHGYGIMNKQTGEVRYIKKMWDEDVAKETREDRMRSNDGAVDSQGRFYVGTMNDFHVPSGPVEEGVLFRLDKDLHLQRVLEPVTIPNGISWGPEDKTVYLTDSPTTEIRRYPHDPSTGDIDFSAGQTFFKCPIEGGVPDGHCQDAEGNFWIAMHGTWKVVKVNPQGEIIAEIHLPTRCVTCPAICGQDLIITTAADEEPEKYPESLKYQGATFKVPIGVEGKPLNKFKLATKV